MLRDSLLLSMLQQMLEDRDQEVRCGVVRALALLTASLNDSDKLTKVRGGAAGLAGEWPISLQLGNSAIECCLRDWQQK